MIFILANNQEDGVSISFGNIKQHLWPDWKSRPEPYFIRPIGSININNIATIITQMTLSEKQLIQLIDQAFSASSETLCVEFKDCRDGLYKQLWKPITAFSNSPGGGVIVMGINEHPSTRKKTVVGGLALDLLQQNIISFLEQKIANKAKYEIKVINYSEHQLLALVLSETPKENKPCYYSDLGMDKGACVRAGNTNRQITEDELRSFLRYTPAYYFDKTVIMNAEIENLDQLKILAFLKTSAERKNREYHEKISNAVLKNLGIIAPHGDRTKPTLAGMLIFSTSQPQDFDELSRYVVRCVRYAGNAATTQIIDKSDIQGTLDVQTDEVLKFIQRNIRTEARIVGSKREERYEFPTLALREVVVNALVHRDYSNKGTYVQVTIFANRIEVSNPGTLPPGVTIENLKNAQFSRNNVIAQVMRDMDYMEEFGRGIDLIYSQMLEWNLPEPLFKNVSNVFKVSLLGKVFRELNERQVNIWNFLQDKSQITATLAHSMFSSVSRPTINNDLKKMQDMELIELKGSANNTYYIPRY